MEITRIKSTFMEYFAGEGYAPSDSMSLLIPELSTTFVLSVGLLQLKAVLTPHAQERRFPDFCMVQRCLRQFDIARAGYANHLSFFEMAGAISSGERTQAEVIQSIIQYLTDVAGIDKKDAAFTAFGGGEFLGRYMPRDEDSLHSLSRLGISQSQIQMRGSEDNFFGNIERDVAYGPSLEIYLDRGVQSSCPNMGTCQPGCPCQRYVEVGTCVFLKYIRDNGSFSEMPQAFCEIGVGVERLAFTSAGLSSIHQLKPLRDVAIFVMEHGLLAKGVGEDPLHQANVCSDHLRAATFAIADGARPGGSGGRQHVMRTLIRRCLIRMSWEGVSLMDALPGLVDRVSEANEHIVALSKDAKQTVCDVLTEEARFFQTSMHDGKIKPDRYLRGATR